MLLLPPLLQPLPLRHQARQQRKAVRHDALQPAGHLAHGVRVQLHIRARLRSGTEEQEEVDGKLSRLRAGGEDEA